MSDQEFKTWREIDKFGGIHVTITEKIHGSNAQILVTKDEAGELHAIAGSRSQWLNAVTGPENFGFAGFVKANEKEICEKLGEGRHYGEWVGPGVNCDYGLKEKVFVLFDTRRNPPEKPLPPRVFVVPVLYDGPYSEDAINTAYEKLKTEGSRFQPGFPRPEGMVLYFPQFGAMKKKVFKPEETGWTKKGKEKDPNAPIIDYLEVARPLLQPIRLEKLLMRDESYRTGFPQNLPVITRAYLADLMKETTDITEDQLKAVKKKVFEFVKEEVEAALTKNPVEVQAS